MLVYIFFAWEEKLCTPALLPVNQLGEVKGGSQRASKTKRKDIILTFLLLVPLFGNLPPFGRKLEVHV